MIKNVFTSQESTIKVIVAHSLPFRYTIHKVAFIVLCIKNLCDPNVMLDLR